jgi:5-methyltetrahydrofolate--homocysteine methyltransferase
MNSDFLKLAAEKVIIGDGAMGTMIQARTLTLEDFGGQEGCNELLVITRPDVIKEIHAAYYTAGADIVETNSFGSSAVVLEEYGLAARAREISRHAAQIAKDVAQQFSTKARPRFVAGSVGPGTKLVTLGHISFDAMHKSYLEQMLGLIEGGVDLLQIETCQDILQVKCAVIAARDAMKELKREVPICVTLTMETTGTMLVGTEMAAALTVLESLPVQMLGMNCATGPDLMQENVRFLSASSSRMLAVIPNAGLPRNVGGCAVYDLGPSALADYHERFVKEQGVNMIGGCCGTTPEHIAELSRRLGNASPAARNPTFAPHVSSTYIAVPLDQDGTSPLIVGERCNSNGSKQFRELLLQENWEALVEMGRQESEEGAHVVDVCTAYVGRDETRDLREVLSRFATQVTAPVMIDSTQLDVMENSLKLVGGRAIINSINLEDGEEKFDKICMLAKRYGAALVALTIDEEGMAKTAQRKLEVAQRMHKRATELHGLSSNDLIYDPLTFTIGSGDEDSRNAGIQTLEGIKLIKEHVPCARTILGLSNISFGLKPYPRQILNSVFLAEAIKYGLDSCIVHSKKILPTHKIAEDVLTITMDLIYDRRREGYDPLFKFIELLQGAKGATEAEAGADDGEIEEVLKKRIIDGRKVGIEAVLERAREKYSPLEIINRFLLDGMKVVGDLFGRGDMQLPFVLQSAETMKKAVSYLEQYMDKVGGPAKGCMVIATVKGDVHDIGKNLVDIILSNNGYKVVNLGIKQPLDSILAACEQHAPQAIGMSGLLVKSTYVMKENLEEMSRRQLSIPVICGGAALNRAYVESDLRKAYGTGPVYYGADAFTGLQLMDEITGHAAEKTLTTKTDVQLQRRTEIRAEREDRIRDQAQEYADSGTRVLDEVPTPPFWGVRYVTGADLDPRKVLAFINKKALFANQWQYRRGSKSTREYKQFLAEFVEPLLTQWIERAVSEKMIDLKVAYGYFPCQSEQNTLIVYDSEDPSRERCRIKFPRQVADKRRCIADYFLPVSSGRRDVVAFHVVTAGEVASTKSAELFAANNYSDYLHFHGISVEAAEALAEYWHKQIRQELGILAEDGKTLEDLFRQSYHGSRYSFGYPACPYLEDQQHIMQLLQPEKIGVSLTSEYQLVPEQSTSAIIVHHPESCYYSI